MRLQEHLDADDRLSVRDGELYLEDCSLAELARRFGTPLNVISQARLQRRARELVREFGDAWSEGPVQVLPSLKANFSLALRRLLTLEGLGCDTFGFGELRAALACGVPPALISVNGSSKSPELMRQAILAGARLTLDSLREVRLAVAIAEEAQTIATVRLRLRPDYSPVTALSEFAAEPHTIADVAGRYKPGLPREELSEAARVLRASDWVTVTGCHAHVGRHRPDLAMWEAVIPCFVREIAAFAAAMGGGWRPRVIDIGGGFAPRRDPVGLSHAPSHGEPRRVPSVADYARCITATMRRELRQAGLPTSDVTLQLEPGRSLYANAGLHLATVVNLKEERRGAQGTGADRTQRWVETDTSEAFLPDVNLEGVRWTVVPVAHPDADARVTADVVGISCGFDVLVQDALLPALAPGDLLAFLDTGAYQDSGSNNFNAMPRPATVLVNGSDAEVIKRAETQADVFRRDVVPTRFGPVADLGPGSADGEAFGDGQEASTGERFHHAGLVVADLERSLGFYRDRLGLAQLATGAESDARYAEMLGVPDVRFAWAELDLGGGRVLELLRFDEPSNSVSEGAADGALEGVRTAPRATPGGGLPGVAHLGIRVDDIDAVHDALLKDGARVLSRPIELAEDNHWLGVRVFYAFDPDGHVVELIQEGPAAEAAGR